MTMPKSISQSPSPWIGTTQLGQLVVTPPAVLTVGSSAGAVAVI